MKKLSSWLILMGIVSVGIAISQTKIDLRTQTRGTAPADVTAGNGISYENGVISVSPEVTQHIYGTTSYDFGFIAAHSCSQTTFTLSGAVVEDTVAVSWPATITNGLVGMAWIGALDTAVIRICNVTAAPIDPAVGNFNLRIVRGF